ncbi:hypothetical protein BRADI_1g44465v3 [Brachypodium distachyon]|uniref:Uncharacterized protein n=1 Tax=Brachypodium distachyon TaxID=15368 RepID=A0A0Q3H7W1_BRADI|nr:hypothetical protein BRADI_1g44465v3 [Brachypodium distachyon]
MHAVNPRGRVRRKAVGVREGLKVWRHAVMAGAGAGLGAWECLASCGSSACMERNITHFIDGAYILRQMHRARGNEKVNIPKGSCFRNHGLPSGNIS